MQFPSSAVMVLVGIGLVMVSFGFVMAGFQA